MDVRSRIRNYIKGNLGLPVQNDSDDLFSLGMVDSLFALRLASFVEQEFAFELAADDVDLDNFRSIDAIVQFVSRRQGTGAGE